MVAESDLSFYHFNKEVEECNDSYHSTHASEVILCYLTNKEHIQHSSCYCVTMNTRLDTTQKKCCVVK